MQVTYSKGAVRRLRRPSTPRRLVVDEDRPCADRGASSYGYPLSPTKSTNRTEMVG